MTTIHIQGEGNSQFSILIKGYENANANAKDIWDKNWLNCAAIAKSGGFSAEIELGITTQDLQDILQILQDVRCTQQKLYFSSTEENIYFDIYKNLLGKYFICVRLCQNDGCNKKIEINFETDEFFIENANKKAQEAAKIFPILM
ncbi:hypothetical protein G7B40_039740 [Aetokthonos hydrillicola Thurmond2011]|jgi:hypothetical protein|uniref:Uncharacterized protein n=1 Tax=Aetokthonos hydrillicola Thurmond2011 TaxID=2712845 RepID=A0AAP5IGZ7_9CYAN|nr:hypothetical protein [Aetokthonos hydrillicola]MBW4590145.1 hypothetical protein [Aetokthonos hydrillicola CCALA 1050]MDR9900624.1 hypothetical protein [Aetokthonos hydrillicola Thurmond2011]